MIINELSAAVTTVADTRAQLVLDNTFANDKKINLVNFHWWNNVKFWKRSKVLLEQLQMHYKQQLM